MADAELWILTAYGVAQLAIDSYKHRSRAVRRLVVAMLGLLLIMRSLRAASEAFRGAPDAAAVSLSRRIRDDGGRTEARTTAIMTPEDMMGLAKGINGRTSTTASKLTQPPRVAATLPQSATVILFLASPWSGGDPLYYLGNELSNPFVSRGCPYSHCVITKNPMLAPRASLIVFRGPFEGDCCRRNPADGVVRCTATERNVTKVFALPSLDPRRTAIMFYQKEAPSRSKPLCLRPLDALVNYTWTYKSDSDIRDPYGRVELLPDSSYKGVSDRPAAAAAAAADASRYVGEGRASAAAVTWSGRYSRNVLWYVSNCNGTRHARSRHAYASELARHIDVDEYGTCSGRSDGCPRWNSSCMELKRARYRFYLAFENSHCSDYVTEKLFDALRHGNVPIVRGLSRAQYERLVPHGSFIHADDFDGPASLARYLRWLAGSPARYAKYHEWRSSYRVIRPSKDVCKLCELAVRRPPKRVRVSEWWAAERNCFP